VTQAGRCGAAANPAGRCRQVAGTRLVRRCSPAETTAGGRHGRRRRSSRQADLAAGRQAAVGRGRKVAGSRWNGRQQAGRQCTMVCVPESHGGRRVAPAQ